MRILITGASGMVGRNLLEHPKIKEFEILTPSKSELNLLNYEAVKQYCLHYKPDLIIHAAGQVGGIQANIREPVRFLLENLDMGRNIIWAARQTETKRLINLGCSCIYPSNTSSLLGEEMILRGELEATNEGYALAKITTARLCQYITREDPTYQYKTIIACNLFGRWDKYDPAQSHMIAAAIQKIHKAKVDRKNEVEIWGDGTARREFMYASHFVDCLVQAIHNFEDMPSLMNIGLGYDYTINEYYENIAEVIGYRGQFIHDLSKPIGMKQKLLNIDKQLDWGWQAQANLKDELKKTYEFYLQREEK